MLRLASIASLLFLSACGAAFVSASDDARSSDASTGTDAGASDSATSDSPGSQDARADAVALDAAEAGIPCVEGDPQRVCPQGYYCKSATCGAGVCTPRPSESATREPICGCNGVTYWNDRIAAVAGVSVKDRAPCLAGTAAQCAGLASQRCPTGTFCNMRVDDSTGCIISDPGGVCWGLPSTCPAVTSPKEKLCASGAGQCTDECSAIKTGKAWFAANGNCQ